MAARLTLIAEILLLCAVVLAPWAYGGAPDAARYALAAVLLLGTALDYAARAVKGAGLPALAPAAAGLPALALVQLLLGTTAAPVWTAEALLLLAAMSGVVVFWSERARHPEALVRVAAAVLFSCAAQAVFGAVQWSRAPDRVYGHASPIVTTPFGSYVNHNHFAGLVAMGVVLSAAMALGHVRRHGGISPASIALGGLSLALAAAHLASRSRGGLVALAAALLILGVLGVASSRSSRVTGRRLALAGVLALVVLGFAVAVIPAATRTHLATVTRGSADSSGAYRMDVAAGTLRLAAAHPLAGSGLGAYADAFPPFKRAHGDVRTTHAESDVLEFLAEGGLAGVLLAAWLAWGLWCGFEDRLRHGRDPFRRSIVAGALAAAAGLAVHSALDFNLRLPANALVFATVLGVAGSPREARPAIAAGRAAPALAALTLALLSFASAWRARGAHEFERALAQPAGDRRVAALDLVLTRHPYLAEAWRFRGVGWRERGWGRTAGAAALAWAESDLRAAVGLRPHWGEAWSDLGWTLFARGDATGARDAFDRAVAADPTHVALARARADFVARTAAP